MSRSPESSIGRGSRTAPGAPLLGQRRQRRAARIGQAEQLGGLVEGLAGGVVERVAEQAVLARRRRRRRAGCGRRTPAARRTETRDAARPAAATADDLPGDARRAPGMPQRVGERAGHAGARPAARRRGPAPGCRRCRRGRRAQARRRASTCSISGTTRRDVIARGELGHDAAVGLVHRDLRVQRMREQPALGVVDGRRRSRRRRSRCRGRAWGRLQEAGNVRS